MIDCYLPWRYHIGECLQHGKFPFWNPYQDLGYPIHADPSSGAWYPIVWIIGYFFGYDVFTIGMEMWLHIIVAGIGFYKLSNTLQNNNNISFIAAISYMLCGIFIGNAQHLTYTISACWIPFILNYYIRMISEPSYLNSIKTAIPLFLLLTGGYPAFTIILFYFISILFIYAILSNRINKKYFAPFIKRNALFFILTIILSSGLLISVWEVSPYISRTNDFGIKQALFCPFSPQSSISFILPFVVIKNMDFFATDLSMSNAYFGILFFMFFIASFFIKKPTLYKIIFAFSFACLLASFGSYLPVREFLFDYVPLMNLFRFPSSFRLFVIIGFIILAAHWLDFFMKNETKKTIKIIKIILYTFIILLITIIIIARLQGYLTIKQFVANELFIFSDVSTIFQHAAFQGAIQLLVISSFLYLLIKIKNKQTLLKYTAVIVAVELIISTQLNAPYTAYFHQFSAKESNVHFKKFPSGFPQLPDIAIADVNSSEMYFGPFWKNVNIIQKQVSAEGFNSFAFTGREFFRDKTPQHYNLILKNKIIFLSDEIHPESELEQFIKDSSFTQRTVILNNIDYLKIKKEGIKSTEGDIAQLIYFAPDSFIVNTQTKEQQIITLLQNNYKGWNVYINNKISTIYTSNKSLISAIVPKGNNTVSFVYNNTKIKFSYFTSALALLTLCSILLYQFKKSST